MITIFTYLLLFRARSSTTFKLGKFLSLLKCTIVMVVDIVICTTHTLLSLLLCLFYRFYYKTMSNDVIQVPALGRPFSLGMLYNGITDQYIPGETLWTLDQLKKNVFKKSNSGTYNDVMMEDSVAERARELDIHGSLKLSVLSGLVEVSGIAQVFYDAKKTKKVARVTLKNRTSTEFEQLTMSHLGPNSIHYKDALDADRKIATHVVVGIQYGADAFFVFEHSLKDSRSEKSVLLKMEAAIKQIPSKYLIIC